MSEFSIDCINQFIIEKQHLTKETKTDNIQTIVKNIGGLHSTSQTAPYLSLFSRMNNFTRSQLDQEAYEKRNLGKIRCIRKTVFIHHKEFLPWIINATRKQHAKRHVDYLANLGVSEAKYQEIVNDILLVLQGRNLSVAELKKELSSKDNISAMVNLACDNFQLIRNCPVKSWRDKRHTYSAFKEYFPNMNLDEITEEESRMKLVSYYLECFGPVTETDIVWWTGFNKTETRSSLEELAENITKIPIESLSKDFLLLNSDVLKLEKVSQNSEVTVNILPDLDPYMMGYKERERYVEKSFYDHIFDRSGNATTTILVNGKVVGIWDFVGSKEPLIKFFLLEKTEKEPYTAIKNELNEIGKFIFAEKVPLKECKTMNPLKTRTPGEVQTPLKYC